jgi:hypothetical protein
MMKVIQRGIMKVVPGKMVEAMELMGKHTAVATRLGCPPMKSYHCLSGGGEFFHTIIGEAEWDSLAAMEAFFEKMTADAEMQELMAKWEAVLESHEIEFYLPMS